MGLDLVDSLVDRFPPIVAESHFEVDGSFPVFVPPVLEIETVSFFSASIWIAFSPSVGILKFSVRPALESAAKWVG